MTSIRLPSGKFYLIDDLMLSRKASTRGRQGPAEASAQARQGPEMAGLVLTLNLRWNGLNFLGLHRTKQCLFAMRGCIIWSQAISRTANALSSKTNVCVSPPS